MSTPSSPLLAELIDIPLEVHHGEFVVSLQDGLDRSTALLDTYVVPPQVASAFADALTLVASSVDSGASRGAFLHASFGGGKSSLMAVLGLILKGHAGARSKEGLAGVVADFDRRVGGRRFLVVPVHMIGARSMEEAVLGGYIRALHELDPEAPLPSVHATDGLFDTARNMIDSMGEGPFFALLGERQGGGGWGKLAGSWNPASFESAVAAPVGSGERDQLVDALIKRVFPTLPDLAQAAGGGFIPFKDGLAAISRHAKSLGYDAVVLLLDELVLWLASRLADRDFAQREGVKIGLLTDAPLAERPVPIVSFVARQRDLRELVGEVMAGSEQMNVADQLSWWEGRFDTVELADRNLPAIVRGRLLRPNSTASERMLDAAFTATTGKAGERVVDTLCTSEMDRATFRQVYPFSPALISALVDLSSVLQRERTALRVLVQLLVDRRNDLRVGELIALGDVYDVLARGDEPFSAEMREHWTTARRLYENRVYPMLLAEHSLTAEAAEALPNSHAFRTDERLVKTLLLAALVPGSAVLADLTVSRLAALNHGTIRTPIPGQERAAVLGKLQRWQAHISELQVDGDATDPVVRFRISGVDAEGVMKKAEGIDTQGERRQMVRRLLFEQLGVDSSNAMFPSKRLLWRGTQRQVDLVFGNVRDKGDIPDASMASDGDIVRVVVDFPFDPSGGTPNDDVARVQQYIAEHDEGTRTVVWLPQFLSERTLKDLGTLVVCEHMVSGSRFEQYASDLSPVDRTTARSMVEARAGALRETVKRALRMAYGLDNPVEGIVLDHLPAEKQWMSLDPTFSPRRPVAATLGDALDKVMSSYLAHLYPAHPEFEEEVRPADLRAVLAEVKRAARDRSNRLDVAALPTRRLLRRIANPAQVGMMHEAHYVPGSYWSDHFERCIAQDKPAVLTIGTVRRWLDEPTNRGLTKPVADLIILAWAATTDRVLRLRGAPYEGDIDKLVDDAELHSDALPDEEQWAAASDRASTIFGAVVGPFPSAAGVAALVTHVKAKARESRDRCVALDGEVRVAVARRGLDEGVDRARTALAARRLVESIGAADDASVIALLQGADVPTSEQAMALSMSSAEVVTAALKGLNWNLVDSAERLDGPFALQSSLLRVLINDALAVDEFADRLAPRLAQAAKEATELVDRALHAPALAAMAGTPAPSSDPVPASGSVDHTDRARAAAVLSHLLAAVEDTSVGFRFTWTVEELAP